MAPPSEMSSESSAQLIDEGYEAVCDLEEVPQMMPKKVDVNGRGVLLCRSDDGLVAVDEICPHKTKSMAYGLVHDDKLICPHHQYEFELESGRCKNKRRCPPATLYDIEVVDDTVYVRAGSG